MPAKIDRCLITRDWFRLIIGEDGGAGGGERAGSTENAIVRAHSSRAQRGVISAHIPRLFVMLLLL